MRDSMLRLRLVSAVFALIGCTAAPAPPAAAPTANPPAEAQREAARVDTSRVCVLEQGELVTALVELQPTGDTTVGGRPFGEVYADTGQYAATHEWYVNNETIDYDPRNVCYVKYGLPRYVASDSLVRLGTWRGVSVFRERSEDPQIPAVIWVPVRPGCSFQPYQYMPSAPPVACPNPEYRFMVP